MDLSLSGNVVAVFGAASGIGAAIAQGFAAEGARLAAIDRDPQVVDLALQFPGSIGLVIDVCDFAAVQRGAVEITHNWASASMSSMQLEPAQASSDSRSGTSSLPTGIAFSRSTSSVR